MGFFAGELEAVLGNHTLPKGSSPWAILQRMGIHPQQIERLKSAAEDLGQVATLPPTVLQQMKQELELAPIEWARLQAGIEADTFLRLLMYHNYPIEEAANKANAVFSAALKDRLTTGGRSETIYAATTIDSDTTPIPPRRRGRRKTNLQDLQ